jgi:hypothetical protein
MNKLNTRLDRIEERLIPPAHAFGVIRGDSNEVRVNGEMITIDEFSRRYPAGNLVRIVTMTGPSQADNE